MLRRRLDLNLFTENDIQTARLASAEMKKSLIVVPHSVQSYFDLANFYLAMSRLDKRNLALAEAVAEQGLHEAPRRFDAYELLGQIKVQAGNFQDSLTYFQTATRLNEQNPDSHFTLGLVSIINKQYQAGEAEIEKAHDLKLDIYLQSNVDRIITAYRQTGDQAALVNFLKRFSQRFPSDTFRTPTRVYLLQLYQAEAKKLSAQKK